MFNKKRKKSSSSAFIKNSRHQLKIVTFQQKQQQQQQFNSSVFFLFLFLISLVVVSICLYFQDFEATTASIRSLVGRKPFFVCAVEKRLTKKRGALRINSLISS